MRVDLYVPFKDKERVKALGARWDAARKTWYVPDGVDAMLFVGWLPSEYRKWKERLES